VACSYGVRAPPGVVMVAPPEVPRNAERAQCEGRAKERLGVHGQRQCKGRSPKAAALSAEHVPSGPLVLSPLLSCGISRPFCRP
jgi:hypothetical protein